MFITLRTSTDQHRKSNGTNATFAPVTLNTTSKMELRTYVIRIGNGSDGTFPRATCKAVDAFAALRIGTRHLGKPWDVRHRDAEGDDDNASLCSYVAPYGDGACRWVMVAQPLEDCYAPIPSRDLTPNL